MQLSIAMCKIKMVKRLICTYMNKHLFIIIPKCVYKLTHTPTIYKKLSLAIYKIKRFKI